MDGTIWEIKRPTGNGRWTLEKQLSRASKQSPNIIIDTRGMATRYPKINKELSRITSQKRGIKRLLIINKKREIIDFLHRSWYIRTTGDVASPVMDRPRLHFDLYEK